eukprot:TRINITY_DN67904_c4_g3_i2.p1 TRINITY_DN67904_c4_g3~~TRINITY_DN67904_c4_g3_i2.p1  ORF type:complete len:237 (-),score=8.02 TRINITY_DN67904_c4_g3_i2:127-837(-)
MNHFLFVGLLLCTWPTVPSDACSCSPPEKSFGWFCERKGAWGRYGSAVYTIKEEIPSTLPPGSDAEEHYVYRATIDEVLVQDAEKHLRIEDTIITGGEVECCACGITLDVNATYVGILSGWEDIPGYKLDKYVWGTIACTPKTKNLTKKHEYLCPGLNPVDILAAESANNSGSAHSILAENSSIGMNDQTAENQRNRAGSSLFIICALAVACFLLWCFLSSRKLPHSHSRGGEYPV